MFAMVYIPELFVPEYRAARKYSLASSDGWWLNRWPLLGWMETFVKIAAWCFVPLVPVQNAQRISIDRMSPAFFMETCIMLASAALISAAIIDRMVYREIISMIFVFPNNWAHWTVASAMLRAGRDGINPKYFRIFCWLMLAGDVVKLVFFAVHDFSLLNVARYVRMQPKNFHCKERWLDFQCLTLRSPHWCADVSIVQVLYVLVSVFALMYAAVLLLDYGFFAAEARQFHSFALARFPKMFSA